MTEYRRTTVMLEKGVYDALVKASVEEYNSTKAISKVINKLVKKDSAGKDMLGKLLHARKLVKTTPEEFYKFRHELSKSLEGSR